LAERDSHGNLILRHYGEFSTHILYAIVLAALFEIGADAFVPIQDVFQNKETLTQGFAIFTVYFIVLAGWISFAVEANRHPHTMSNLGMARFAVDIFIMTLLFYLVTLTDSKNFDQVYGQAFTWVLPVLYLSYMIWDLIEFKEYKDVSKIVRYAIASQFRRSTIGFILMLFQAFAFVIVSLFFWKYEVYFAFTMVTAFIVFIYRVSSWNIASLRPGSVRTRRTRT
jgi:hypothetical protein